MRGDGQDDDEAATATAIAAISSARGGPSLVIGSHGQTLGCAPLAIGQVRVRVIPVTCWTLGTTVGLQVGRLSRADAHHDVVRARSRTPTTARRAGPRAAWRRLRRGPPRSGSA